MLTYRLIRTTGKEAKTIGYRIPNLYQLRGMRNGLKILGFDYIRYILKGEQVWFQNNTTNYAETINSLNKLKKTHEFDFYYFKR